jgi:hypothetical protein
MEALRLFNGRELALPMPPFGRHASSPNLPMVGHITTRQFLTVNDQRERSRHLMQKWQACQRNIEDTSAPDAEAAIPKSNSEETLEPDEHSHCKTIEHEMMIQSNSLVGTTEAAAWHLHGQSGRVAPSENNHFGTNVSVMNSKSMSKMRRDNRSPKLIDSNSKERSARDQDIECGTFSDETDVLVDIREYGDTLITSKSVIDPLEGNAHQDLWSTGVASAIVMGTAARYHKNVFMFPHGRRVLLPLIMALMALALSIFVSRSCRFMSVLPSSSLNQVFQIGPWFYLSTNPQSDEVCMPYPSDMELDFWFTVSRAMSALAVCFGVGLLLWTATLTCIPYSRSSLSWLGLCFFGASILQLSTSFFYLSDNCKGSVDEMGNVIGGGYFGGVECTANQDLVFTIAASAMYFATGWLLYIAQGVIANDPGTSSSEVYTWSAVSKYDDPQKGMRTIEKSWIRIPDGSTLMATVVVERRKGKKGIKTTHRVKTEILPAT